MASVVETKAVALRRGTHEENLAFTGVQGEVVADLGNADEKGNLGTDANATLRLHDGITKGGIPMAREDMLNVTTQCLAENRESIDDKNLAYADLSNITQAQNTQAREKIVFALKSAGLAAQADMEKELDNKVNVNTDNLNTKQLTSKIIHNGVEAGNDPLAYANTSNINTADLTNITYHDGTDGNKPLAYADLSNVDTTNITLPESERTDGIEITGPVIARADLSNVDTSYLTSTTRPEGMSGPILADNKLSNVDLVEAINNVSDTLNLQRTTEKDKIIEETSISNGHYPETNAVVQYVNKKISENGSGYANDTLTNIESWDSLTNNTNKPIMSRGINVISSANGFELYEEYDTGIYLIDDEKDWLAISVTEVSPTGAVSKDHLSIEKSLGTIDLTSQNPITISPVDGNDAKINLKSTSNNNGTYTYSIESVVDGGSGFTKQTAYAAKSTITGNLYKVVCNQLKALVTKIQVDNEEDGTGVITEAQCNYKNGFTVVGTSKTDVNATITSSKGTVAELAIFSDEDTQNKNGSAKLTKTDLTNLRGMTSDDQFAEMNSPWRVRHNEQFPSLSMSTLPEEQQYTLATNGAIWRILKKLFKATSVSVTANFIPNATYTEDPSNHYLMDDSGKLGNGNEFQVFPNDDYQFVVEHSNLQDRIFFHLSNTNKAINYSVAVITFNLDSTIDKNTVDVEITRTSDGRKVNYLFDTDNTAKALILDDSTYTVTKDGAIFKSGSLSISTGNQTITIDATPAE